MHGYGVQRPNTWVILRVSDRRLGYGEPSVYQKRNQIVEHSATGTVSGHEETQFHKLNTHTQQLELGSTEFSTSFETWYFNRRSFRNMKTAVKDQAATYKQTTNSVALSPQAKYTDWATATCRRNLVPTFVDRGVSRGQRGGSRTAVNLSFLDRRR
jgi:hypothetical protein